MNSSMKLDEPLLRAWLEIVHYKARPQRRFRKPPVQTILIA